MEILAGVLIIANHKRAVATRKYFNNGGKQGMFIIFLGCYADVSVFSWEIK